MKRGYLIAKLIFITALFFGVTVGAFAQTTTFLYTGSVQTFVVPACAFHVSVQVAGAQGGDGDPPIDYPFIDYGGLGGSVSCVLNVTGGTTLYVYVGQQPTLGSTWFEPGGINSGGGADGGISHYAGGGGAASDIRMVAGNSRTALLSRIAVGGGGGGGSRDCGYMGIYDVGGAGGYPSGGAPTFCGDYGTGIRAGYPGTQISGGGGGLGATSGDLGFGGSVDTIFGDAWSGTSGAGGGGGWYGAGGASNEGGACGGSSYVNGSYLSGTATYSNGSQHGNGFVTITPIYPTISGATSVCSGLTATMSCTESGGTWSCSDPAVGTISSSGVFTGISGGGAFISYTIGSCVRTAGMDVYNLPTMTGASQVCEGSATTLTCATFTGGTWSSSNTAVGSVSAAGTVTGILAGTASITYTATTGCLANETMTVKATPSITGPAAVCAGSTITLNTTLTGGTWSSSHTSVGTISTGGAVTGVSAGTTIISYVLSSGCFATHIVTVNPQPSAIAYAMPVCVGSTVSLSNTLSGGAWSSSNTSTGTISTGGALTGISAGTSVVTYFLSTGCLSATTVTVNSSPAPITGTSLVCAGSTTTLSCSSTGGTWSSSYAAVGTISSSGVFTGISGGTAIVSYTFSSGCSSTEAVTVPGAITFGGGIISTIAGNGTAGYSGDGMAATSAEIYYSTGVAVDGSGNLYIADYFNSRIRKVSTSGVISTIAGDATWGYSGDGGPAMAGELNEASGVAVDNNGNIFIADYNNHRIRKVNSSGIISTIAGNGTGGYSGDGGPATAGELNEPSGVAVDNNGNIFIADYNNRRIRKVNSSGIISTIAGNGTAGYSGDGIVANTAELNNPTGVAVDASGNVYIADLNNNRIRKVNTSGIITTIAGNGTAGYSGDGVAATAAELYYPYGIAVDGGGNVYIADKGNNLIRKVNGSGIISTISGNSTGGYSGDGGPATSAELADPNGVAVDGNGNVYISDGNNDIIRKVTFPTGSALCAGTAITLSDEWSGGAWSSSNISVGTISGFGVFTGVASGTTIVTYSISGCMATGTITVNATPAISGTATVCMGSTTTLSSTSSGGIWSSSNTGVATISTGGVITGISAGTAAISYTSGAGCGSSGVMITVPFVGPVIAPGGGIISTVAGNGTAGYSGDGVAATASELYNSTGVAVDGSGNIYIADRYNNRIRKVNTSGVISTIAGNGTGGYTGDGGAATAYELHWPTGVAVDGSGNLYIADAYNNRIRKVSSSGIISTVAGYGTAGYSGDGVAANATELNNPSGVAVDGSGNIYIADAGNNRVRKVNTSGIISTIAGNDIGGYSGDGGDGIYALLSTPSGVAVDDSGAVYIADQYNNVIRKINTAGVIYSIAGNGTAGYSGDGSPATGGELQYPFGVAVDGSGNIYIADQYNNRIRKVNTSGEISTVAGNGIAGYSGDNAAATARELNTPMGVAIDGNGNMYIADLYNSRIRKVTGSSSNGTVCSGSAIILSDATSGGIWSSGNTAVGTISGSGVFTGVGAGTAIVTYSLSGCTATGTMTVTAISPITGTLIVSVGSSTTLGDATSGGRWSSGNTTVATIGSGTGVASGVAAGTSAITYTATGGCRASATVDVVPAPLTWYSSSTGGDASTLINWWATNSNTGGHPTSFTTSNTTWIFQGAMTSTAALSFTGNVSIVSGGTFTPLAASITTVGGNWKNTGGSFVRNGGTVVFNGANGVAADTLSAITGGMTGANAFNNLTFSAAGVSYTFGNNAVDLAGTFSQSTGTVIASSGNLNIGGNFSHTGGVFTPNGGTVTMNGGSATITATGMNTLTTNCFNNLSFSSSSTCTYTIASPLLLMGNFNNLNASGTIAVGNNDLTIGGNWNNAGPFTSGTSHILMNGSGVHTMAGKM